MIVRDGVVRNPYGLLDVMFLAIKTVGGGGGGSVFSKSLSYAERWTCSMIYVQIEEGMNGVLRVGLSMGV